MTLFTKSRLNELASYETLAKSATTASILRESRTTIRTSYNVFLCHSKMDSEYILGVKRALETIGLTVYVDWIDDPQLDRSAVTARTADILRTRMQASKMLVYAHTVSSTTSRWCPWELGYFDGHKGGNVFLLPIVDDDASKFIGQEYLGLYPYLDRVGSSIFINYPDQHYALREAVTAVFRPL